MRYCTESDIAGVLANLEAAAPRIVVSGNFATPWELVRIADEHLPSVRFFALNPQLGFPDRDGVIIESPFLGPAGRRNDRCDYIPMRLSLAPRLFSTTRPPDAVFIHTSTPVDGKVSLSLETNIIPAAIEEARRRGAPIIAQINANLPYTFGDSEIDVEHVDYALIADTPLPSPNERPPDEAANAIGERIAGIAVDGTTLQMGIGMLPDASLVEVVAQAIRRYELRCVVFDPVMVSTSGAALMDAQAMDLVARVLIPRVQLVTPNLDEAALLLARPVQTRPEMEAAAAELLARGAAAVLLKGGHLSGDGVHDLLLRPGCAPLWFSAPRIVTGNAHGTGCTLSSAIAAGLARGLELEAAVGQAHQFVRAALHSGADVATGSGNGPLNHGFAPQPMHRLPLQRL